MDINEAVEKNERFLGKYLSVNRLLENVEKSKSKYKICVQLSGGLRNFEKTSEWINKFLIEPLNADVFFFGWCNHLGVEENKSKMHLIDNIKYFTINNLNDKSFSFLGNDQHNYGLSGFDEYSIHFRVKSQFFNIHGCNELMKKYEEENGFQYDIVIRARPDSFFFNKFEDGLLDKIFESENSVFVPTRYFGRHFTLATTDCFAIGNRNAMEIYSNMVNHFDVLQRVIGNGVGAEHAVDHYLKEIVNLTVESIEVNFTTEYPYDFSDVDRRVYMIDTFKNFESEEVKSGKQWSNY